MQKYMCILVAAIYIGIGSHALTAIDERKLTATDAAAGARFGASAAVDGSTAIVGAPGFLGAAYIFVRSGLVWTQQAKLTQTDGGWDWFGASVAIDGDIAIVGAPLDEDAGPNSGSAYVFVRSGADWTEKAKLTASDGAAADFFGSAVAVSGNAAIVGAPSGTVGSSDPGSAYIFTDWTEEEKLTPSDGEAWDRFGSSVAIDGDMAIVGAPWDDGAGSDSGSAYMFARNGADWTEIEKLTAADAAARDGFGNSVSLSGNTAVVGALLDDNDNGINSGSVYMFVFKPLTGWEQKKYIASDGNPEERFGISVAIDGNTAIVGAILYDDPLNASDVYGYVFARDENDPLDWIEKEKLTTGSGAWLFVLRGESGFIDISGCTVIIGTELDDEAAIDAGSAYAYLVDTCPCRVEPAEMVSWWTLNEPSGLISEDSVGSNNGTWVNDPFPTPGIVDGALEFDGHGRYVEVPHHSSLSFGNDGNFTIDAWIKRTNVFPVASIVDKRDPTTGRGYGLRLVDARLGFIISDGSSSSMSYLSTETIPLDSWSHVAVTVDRTQDIGRVYINGQPKGSFIPSDTASGNIDNTNPFYIANDAESNYFFGLIDEVELFGRVLKASEIEMIYDALSGGKCKPCVRHLSCPPVAWWPLDTTDQVISIDIAGSNDGDQVGNPVLAPGKVDSALNFNGFDQYVKVPDHPSLNFGADDSFSIDAWIRPTTVMNRLSMIVDKWDPDTQVGYRLYMRSGRLIFHVSDGSSPQVTYISPPTVVIRTGTWTLVAVTVNLDTGDGYVYIIDTIGPFQEHFVFSTPSSISNTWPLFIGGNVHGDYFHGRLDEVEIFNCVLTETDINKLYIADKAGKCKPEDEEDFSNVFFMSLSPGLNMISLPLNPSTPYTARSLAEHISAVMVIKYDEAMGRFVGFTPSAPGDGFPIEGGKGYIVNVPDGGVVAFIGAAWANEPPVEIAPTYPD